MIPLSPLRMIALGFVLMLVGVALPLLMVLGVLPTGFVLSFAAHFASFGGLLLGMLGLALYVRLKRRE